jgi:8-oxo-dGTP pyrophosphatase MutT (NUDIX family)
MGNQVRTRGVPPGAVNIEVHSRTLPGLTEFPTPLKLLDASEVTREKLDAAYFTCREGYMSTLGRRIRSRWDYVFFQVANEWPILLSAVGVILAAAAILPSSVAIVLGVIAFVVGVGALVRDLDQLRRQWSQYEFRLIAAPVRATVLPPPRAYPDPVYLYIPGRGTALISNGIDRVVTENELAAELDEEPYVLPKSLKASMPYVLRAMNRGRLVFNGKVVGMRGDPLPPAPYPAPPIRLHIARFFDAQCSNEMCQLRITHRQGGDEFDPRQRLLTSANGYLNTLAESTLADVVGISTVALTTDGELVLGSQTHRNVGSPMLLAPSGSGSLHPDDLDRNNRETLQDTVRRGMERELREETGIRRDEIVKTTVIGFARWLERGAKPEFLGVTELSITASDLADRRHLTAGESLYSGGAFTTKLDLSLLGDELSAGTELLDAASLPALIKDTGSLPLLLALRVAALWRLGARHLP